MALIGSALIGGIKALLPSFFGASQSIVETQVNGAVQITQSDNATRASILPVLLGHLTMWPIFGMMMVVFFHMAKVVTWDTDFGLGSTSVVTGDVGTWMNQIVISTFGLGQVAIASVGAASVARSMFNR